VGTEVCDFADNDCDGTVDDDDAADASSWYVDADSDGYGSTTSAAVVACDAPSGQVADNTDCDDSDSGVNPGASERCDSVDNDCNGTVDDNVVYDNWYPDTDGDGYGATTGSTSACAQPSGSVLATGDCDDTTSAVNPGATEVCNGIDDDCDGSVDGSGSADAVTWYIDTDGDGYGSSFGAQDACSQPIGTTSQGGDCDDTEELIFPGATEYCDDVDNDCNGAVDDNATDTQTWYPDVDLDGFGDSSDAGTEACDGPTGYVADALDCNDNNSNVSPSTTELCDSIDNDCDGTVDEDDAADTMDWYPDNDGDGFGDSSTSTTSCDAPSGYVSVGTDCDDSAAAVNPDATETCNSVDDNCDGTVDEDTASDAGTWYADSDGDGYGNASSSTNSCSQPSGYVSNSTDCNDSAFLTNPDATEICDSVDNDCNGLVDDGTGLLDWYVDSDGDGFGNPNSTPISSCTSVSGHSYTETDCNDNDATINPNATEVCDDVDNDCDGTVDGSASSDATAWYLDSDGDGYGAAGSTATNACDQPSGYVSDATDCNDSAAAVNPGATELCNNVDDDCDGTTDGADATDITTWYTDSDGDTYGSDSATGVASCSQPSGSVANAQDCNDSNAAISPAATEVCDNVDNDCDGAVDGSSATDATTFYADSDGDGYGDASSTAAACSQPSGYLSDSSDCDDTDSSISPVGTEVCDLADNDCDGTVDEDDATDAGNWYTDGDSDGYGSTTSTAVVACNAPTGRVGNNTDCNDSSSSVNPGATERCNSIDDDCNGTVDDNVIYDDWYPDADSDGYGANTTATSACVQPGGYVLTTGDCNDSSAAVSPAATEVCNNVDDDCDGTVDGSGSADAMTYYTDSDGDGYGVTSTAVTACTQPSGTATAADDCDDTEADVYPGANEYCDFVDNDCDGTVDESAVDQQTWYPDLDSDGFGDASHAGTVACDAPTSAWVSDNSDCNDSDSAIAPSASEFCSTVGVDDDCDGTADEADAADTKQWYADDDSDGYGDPNDSQNACTQIAGRIVDNTDCDDTSSSVNPGEDEVCDGVDNDCDGVTDPDNSTDATSWYNDNDGDGYGGGTAVTSCSQVIGRISTGGDCNDSDALISPGETSDPADCQDNDCDGSTDEDASYTYTHDTDIQPIWNANCTGCHPSSGGLSLTGGFSALVNVASGQSSRDRVEPCLTGDSYLWHKLNGTQSSVGGSGGQMPNGSPALSASDLSKIETWINEGAPQ
jgi:hypothetical protein